jgi:hypothetical protein
MLEPILYSVVVGFLLLTGYLIRSYHFEVPILKAAPLFPPWLSASWGEEQNKTAGNALLEPLEDQPDLLSSCSSDWWEDDGLFQLEKRAIFSKVGD